MITFWMNPNDAGSTAPILVYPQPTEFHTVRLIGVNTSVAAPVPVDKDGNIVEQET